jgi:hypothetical protein
VENTAVPLEIVKFQQGVITVCLLGVSPLVHNRPSEKAKRTLILPGGRPSKTELAKRLKHNPVEEFRESPHIADDANAPTLIVFPSSAFKGTMLSACSEMDGVFKSRVGRLCYVQGDYTSIYGIPKLFMAVVRQSGIQRAPDIRTRAIMPEWAARVQVRYILPQLNPQSVVNLLSGGGQVEGIGDGRVGKLKLNYGMFEVVAPNDPRFLKVVAEGGREAQQAALDVPECYDREAASMLEWFDGELQRRKTAGKQMGDEPVVPEDEVEEADTIPDESEGVFV